MFYFNIIYVVFGWYLVLSSCFTIPTKTYNKKISNIGELAITEPFFNEEKNDAILFFTGGSSNIPQEIYTSFLNGVASNNISCYTFNNNLENVEKLFKLIEKRHNNIGLVGHSSGCMTALENSNVFSKLKSIVLFDPVDDRIIKNARNNFFGTFITGNQEKEIDICCPENFVVVKSEKSYKWNFNPIRTPFIPFFGLNINNINFNNKEYIENNIDDFDFDLTDDDLFYSNTNNFNQEIVLETKIKEKCNKKLVINLPNYGHCDIIDDRWSNIMRSSIAMGIIPRDEKILQNYRNGCSFIVSSTLQDIMNPKIIKKELMNNYKMKNNINKL